MLKERYVTLNVVHVSVLPTSQWVFCPMVVKVVVVGQ